MKKIYLFLLSLVAAATVQAQELYVSTEPASNMPKNSIGLRLTTELPPGDPFKIRTSPEIMIGASKSLMLHASGYISNMAQARQKLEGFSTYAKYRFLSIDSVQRHFRAAVFAKYAYSNNPVSQQDINLEGDNTGVQAGLIATQLLHKLALSGSVSLLERIGDQPLTATNPGRSALAYTFSSGYLIYPKTYTDYSQPNINVYLEFLGKSTLGQPQSYLEAAPAIQLILNSKFRIDVSKRLELYGNMSRSTRNMFLVRLEYNLFNIL